MPYSSSLSLDTDPVTQRGIAVNQGIKKIVSFDFGRTTQRVKFLFFFLVSGNWVLGFLEFQRWHKAMERVLPSLGLFNPLSQMIFR